LVLATHFRTPYDSQIFTLIFNKNLKGIDFLNKNNYLILNKSNKQGIVSMYILKLNNNCYFYSSYEGIGVLAFLKKKQKFR
jgi:hypothetical protein